MLEAIFGEVSQLVDLAERQYGLANRGYTGINSIGRTGVAINSASLIDAIFTFASLFSDCKYGLPLPHLAGFRHLFIPQLRHFAVFFTTFWGFRLC